MIPIGMIVDIVKLRLNCHIHGSLVPVGAHDGDFDSQVVSQIANHIGKKIILNFQVEIAHVPHTWIRIVHTFGIIDATDGSHFQGFICFQSFNGA